MKNITVFVSENFKFLEEKFSIYLNRRVFVMNWKIFYIVLADVCGKQEEVFQGVWCSTRRGNKERKETRLKLFLWFMSLLLARFLFGTV